MPFRNSLLILKHNRLLGSISPTTIPFNDPRYLCRRFTRFAHSYENFAHQKISKPWFYHLHKVGALILSACVFYKYYRQGFNLRSWVYACNGLKETEIEERHEEDIGEDLEDGFDHMQVLNEDDLTRPRPTFRQRKIISYENRIRNFSTHDKVFRYFATLRTNSDHKQCPDRILMTRSDFIRALTPDIPQPEGLDLDRFKRFDPSKQNWRQLEERDSLFPPKSVFDRFVEGGLLSYADFVFLATTLTIPIEQLRYVFRMIDEDDNGSIEPHEYAKMRLILTKKTAGSIHSEKTDYVNTDNPLASLYVHGSLQYVFFPNFKGILTLDEFLAFFNQLHDELNWIAFMRHATLATDDVENAEPSLTPNAFCRLLSTYIFRSDRRRKQMKESAREQIRANGINSRISFKEYRDFTQFLDKIPDAKRFFFLYASKQLGSRGSDHGLDKRLLKRIALDLADVHLSDTIVNSLFAMFDVNGDGYLSESEFFRELKRFSNRGSGRPRGDLASLIALLRALPSYILKSMKNIYDEE